MGDSMTELDLLSPAFRERLDQFPLSISKRKIVHYWTRKKHLCNTIEDQIRLFLSLKPLLFHAYKEEYPKDPPPDYERLLDWLTDCAMSADLLGNIEQRNIWIDLYSACEWIYYLDSFLKRNSQVLSASSTVSSSS